MAQNNSLDIPAMLMQQAKDMQNQFAYAVYSDSKYTSSSPLKVANGETGKIKLTCDGKGSTTQNTIPLNEKAWWDSVNNKMICANLGDTYRVRVNCTVDIGIAVTLDLAQSLEILNYTGPNTASKTASVSSSTVSGLTSYTARVMTFYHDIIGSQQFFDNGAELYIRADKILGTVLDITSTAKVYNISVAIFRQRKGA